jgi:signal transduction histidine kinase
LLVLALVPSVAMIIVGVLNSTQLYDNWHNISSNNTESVQAATPVLTLFNELQTERQLSAAVLADPGGYQEELDQQRKATDTATTSLFALPVSFPGSIESGVRQIEQALAQLNGYRTAVDERSATQQQVYDDYTGLIGTDLQLFSALSNSGLADVNYYYRPIEDSLWGEEMISRESAILTPGIVGGSVTPAERSQVAQLVGAEQFIYDDEIVPTLPAAESDLYRKLLAGSAWTQKTQVEQFVLGASGSGSVALSPALGEQWQQSIATLSSQLQSLNYNYGDVVTSQTEAEVHTMAVDLFVNGGVGALGVLLVVSITVLLTGVLRRRIQILRAAAIDLQVRLPEAVERLRRGESVDIDAEFAEIGRGTDELAMLGRALNAARATALETSLRQVEQYRGFERLLQRIARRTQLLIGLQAKKISEMERRYENAEVLEALFDLDHLTARLRRYEENLVILGGGQPQRRWRKPVTLLDVLRSAQGEVQDYQRIRIEIEGRMWLSQRAVGAMVHVLAELMENAVSFSKPPTPVEVTASRVGHGLAVEIEDRGMGMVPEQIDEANALMANPPRMDAVSRADDARLGMYVVARLAAGLGVKVEFRASSFGGTRVVVLVPEDLVLDEGPASPAELDDLPALPRRLTAVGLAGVASGTSDDNVGAEAYATGSGHNGNGVYNGNGAIGVSRPAPAPVLVAVRSAEPEAEFEAEPEAEPELEAVWVAPPPLEIEPAPRLDPLPRRVRLASLAAELREPRPGADEPADDQAERQPPPISAEPGRSSATIGAFQRQSRIARTAEEADRDPVHPAPRAEPTREEDRG